MIITIEIKDGSEDYDPTTVVAEMITGRGEEGKRYTCSISMRQTVRECLKGDALFDVVRRQLNECRKAVKREEQEMAKKIQEHEREHDREDY